MGRIGKKSAVTVKAGNEGELVVRSDDVFLVSYPKSGNTWARFMLSYVLFPELKEGDVDFRTMELYVPDLHVGPPRPDLPAPRVMKTHSPYSEKYRRVIYMVRDGRDAVVSYYYHTTQRGNFQGTFSEFLRWQTPFGTWADHVKGWLGPHPSQDIMVVKYEELKSSPVKVLKRMMDFIGVKANPERLRAAVEWSSFNKMKKIEKEKGLPHPGAENQEFVRKGQVGGWEEEFSESDLEFFLNTGAREMLDRMGYQVK